MAGSSANDSRNEVFLVYRKYKNDLRLNSCSAVAGVVETKSQVSAPLMIRYAKLQAVSTERELWNRYAPISREWSCPLEDHERPGGA